MGAIYDAPHYYETAFSYRNIAREVDVLEECIRRFDDAPVRRALVYVAGMGRTWRTSRNVDMTTLAWIAAAR